MVSVHVRSNNTVSLRNYALQSHSHVFGQSSPLFFLTLTLGFNGAAQPGQAPILQDLLPSMHAHTSFSFQHTTHHLVVGTRPPATAGPVLNDVCFGLLLSYWKSHVSSEKVPGGSTRLQCQTHIHSDNVTHTHVSSEGNHVEVNPNKLSESLQETVLCLTNSENPNVVLVCPCHQDSGRASAHQLPWDNVGIELVPILL